MVVCTCCNTETDAHRIIICSVCKSSFNIDCVSIPSSLVRHLRPDSGFMWHCKDCKDLNADLNMLKTIIMDLRKEVIALREGFGSAAQSADSMVATERIVQEVAERERRKNNIVIYGVAESSQSTSRRDQHELDVASVGDILTFLGASADGISLTRLGKYDSSRQVSKRPIRVALSSENAVTSVLRRCRNLRDYRLPGIALSRDKTPMQADLYKRVRMELQQRLAAGESDLYIKYTSGIPAVAKSKSRSNPEN